jgi:hypothetical protein
VHSTNPDAPLHIQGHFRTAQQLASGDDGHRVPHRIGILRALLTVMVVGLGLGGGRCLHVTNLGCETTSGVL